MQGLNQWPLGFEQDNLTTLLLFPLWRSTAYGMRYDTINWYMYLVRKQPFYSASSDFIFGNGMQDKESISFCRWRWDFPALLGDYFNDTWKDLTYHTRTGNLHWFLVKDIYSNFVFIVSDCPSVESKISICLADFGKYQTWFTKKPLSCWNQKRLVFATSI